MIERAVFLGSKKFGFEVFKALYEADESVQWTIMCPPDLNDLRTFYNEFTSYARKKDIDLLLVDSPEKIVKFAKDHHPNVIIVCGYYRILPEQLFKNVSQGVWGIHNSLLPKYRGGSPLVWQVINREKVLGSTFFKFSDGMDEGAILDQVSIENTSNLTIADAGDLIELEWIKKLPKIWKKFSQGKLVAKEQNHKEATYCAQRQEYDGEINWQNDASSIDAFIRAQEHPYPRAFFLLNGKKVKVVKHKTDSRVVFGTIGQVFEVREDYVTICCGDNSILRLITLEVDCEVVKARELLKSIKERLV